MRNIEEETLDPDDWEATRALAHRMVDEAVEHLAQVRERPVWTPMPEDVRARLQTGLPEDPAPLDEVYGEYRENVAAYPMGNVHPRFWGWYMGASNFTGALGDFLAAVEGSNLGGGNTGAAQVEQQVVDWLKEIAGFPKTASGTLTSGGSMANLVAHTVIRNLAAGYDVRKEGIAGLKKPLRFYASDQVHSCHQKALETLGLGAKALVEVASDDSQRMRLDALAKAIAEDRANGLQPACVIGTAGTTNTGAIDDLTAIADLCEREGLWFHVDGCIGGVLRLAPDHAHLVAGIERAGSVAIDPHKWLHTPFEAGAVLIKDPEAKFGRLIAKDIALARYLEEKVKEHPLLELFAPVDLNIVCFRHVARDEDASKALNTEIMLRLQERGLAVPSDTIVQGKHGLRCAFNNHRTRRGGIDGFLVDVLQIAQEIDMEQTN
jgi:glutamate/tyrosine decarboxylase-like PLP-dependent enzyme